MTQAGAFVLPPELAASSPPEERGLRRDEVRLLVANEAGVTHARFHDLTSFLSAGDVLVVNTSATVPAAVSATRADGRPVVVHFSAALGDDVWTIELRTQRGGEERVRDGRRGDRVLLPDGVELHLLDGYPDARVAVGSRLWLARIEVEGGVPAYLSRHGRPITYGYVDGRWPLESYQTVFARHPGSAEMPSAGRPFTPEVVTRLVAEGVLILPIVLHAGVSSLEKSEAPLPERFEVPADTAVHVALARSRGSRVIAVGTTAVRALETVAAPDGSLSPGTGWTELVLGPDRPAYVTDGLISGFHAPDASHLLLLEAVVGAEVLRRTYDAALAEGYLWHEFGDTCLLLRPSSGSSQR
jgi:S-adenosylmethionine:tRNA ribosyltransferase-isomerase